MQLDFPARRLSFFKSLLILSLTSPPFSHQGQRKVFRKGHPVSSTVLPVVFLLFLWYTSDGKICCGAPAKTSSQYKTHNCTCRLQICVCLLWLEFVLNSKIFYSMYHVEPHFPQVHYIATVEKMLFSLYVNSYWCTPFSAPVQYPPGRSERGLHHAAGWSHQSEYQHHQQPVTIYRVMKIEPPLSSI